MSGDEPGQTYTLHAAQLGSIGQGTSVYFRGIKVGEVLGYELSDTDGSATVHLFVHAPHDKLVHTGTRFWNASGIAATAGSDALHQGNLQLCARHAVASQCGCAQLAGTATEGC